MPINLKNQEVMLAAIEGYEARKRQIDDKISELRAMLSGNPTETAAQSSTESVAKPEPVGRKRKRFSAATLRKMREAQKARWAKIRGESEEPAPAKAEVPKPRRKGLSAAGRRAIIEATKKRWAAVRAAKAATEKAAPKKAAKRVKKAAAKRQGKAPVAAQAAAATA